MQNIVIFLLILSAYLRYQEWSTPPEADKNIIEKIIGFKIEIEDVEIIVNGKKIMISRKSAKALNLLT